MNIAFVTDRLPTEPGGVQTVVVELATQFGADHDVVVAVPGSTPRQMRSAPLRSGTDEWSVVDHHSDSRARLLSAPAKYVQLPLIRRYAHGRSGLPAARLYGFVGGRALASTLPRRPDVVHAFSADMVGHLALGVGRAVEAPCVVTGFPHPGQYGDGPIDRSAYRNAGGVVALTGHDRDVYVGLGVPTERISVISPPSVNLGTDSREIARRRLGIEGPLAVFAGVRRDYKGADILYRAAPLIGDSVEQATVAFVGPGDALPPLSGVTIKDTGEVDSAEMADWLRAADVVVLPSLHEICPIVILEAWSAGVPVVVSDIPPLKHLADVSGAGIPVPREPGAVAAAIVGLFLDTERRQKLGRLGRSYWELHCTLDRIVKSHLELYANLIDIQIADSGNIRQR